MAIKTRSVHIAQKIIKNRNKKYLNFKRALKVFLNLDPL